MRPLVVRAAAWMMLAMLASALLVRLYVETRAREFSRQVVTILLEMGLDEHVMALELAPASERTAIIADMPPSLRAHTSIIEQSELPTSLRAPAYIEERPVWAERGQFYIGLRGEQLLVLSPPMGPFDTDPGTVFFGLVFVASILASLAIVLPVSRRLRVLTQASSLVAGGDLSVRVADPGKDAIGALARQFDRMTESIDAQRREREAFFHSVAHELGTPMARMGLILELLSDAPDGQGRARRMDQLRVELDELEDLTTELLAWAAEDHDRPLETEDIDVAEVVGQLCAREPVSRVAVHFDGAPGVVVRAEPTGFRRAIDNVLRNARRYARQEVHVRVRPVEGAVEVWVEDDGHGVAPADRRRMFEPFARVDESRDRGTGGTGLGLAIVSRILSRHGGEARATGSLALRGLAVVLLWPRQ